MGYFLRNKKLIHYLITALLMFGLGFLPPLGPLTAHGMGVLGVFIGAVYGWSTINMGWPSIMALIALGMQVGMSNVLAASFGSPVIAMMFMLLPLLALLNESNATDLIANFFVTNRLTKGRPWLLIFLMFMGIYVCTLMNPFIAIMLFMTFIRQICKAVAIPLLSPFTAAMGLGVALSAMVGQIMLPFLNTGLTMTAAFSAMTQVQLPYGQYMLFIIPMGIFLMAIYTLIMRFVLRIDVRPLKQINDDVFGGKKVITTAQKMSLSLLLIFIVIVLMGTFLPKAWLLTQILSRLTIFGQAGILAVICMIMIMKDGKPFFDFNKMAASGMAWDVIFLTAFIIPIATFLTAEDTGVKELLAWMLQPLLGLPSIIFVIAVLAFATIVTNFANNMIVAVVIMPVIFTFSQQVGMSPYGMIMLLFIFSQMALATPGGSPLTGLCYSYSDMIKAPMMMKYALIAIPILFILCLLVGLPYSSLIF